LIQKKKRMNQNFETFEQYEDSSTFYSDEEDYLSEEYEEELEPEYYQELLAEKALEKKEEEIQRMNEQRPRIDISIPKENPWTVKSRETKSTETTRPVVMSFLDIMEEQEKQEKLDREKKLQEEQNRKKHPPRKKAQGSLLLNRKKTLHKPETKTNISKNFHTNSTTKSNTHHTNSKNPNTNFNTSSNTNLNTKEQKGGFKRREFRFKKE